MPATIIPDLDKYTRVPVNTIPGHDGGCAGCAFRRGNFKCSAIPCHARSGRPAAIYISKEPPCPMTSA